jgi:hypothetical protein
MTIVVLSFLVGSALIGVAIIGQGFELKELKIPRVGILARLVSAGAGLAFIGLSLGLFAGKNPGMFAASASRPLANGFIERSTGSMAVTDSTAASTGDPGSAAAFETDTTLVPFEGLSGASRVAWNIGQATYEAVLRVEGRRGTVTVAWIDQNGNSEQVDEQLRLEQDANGIRYRGSDAVYSGTSTPFPDYPPDLFTIVKTPAGWTYGPVCDNQGCHDSTIR